MEGQLYTTLKKSSPFFVCAGPNVIQSEEHLFKMCRQIKLVTDELDVPLVFKSSFDKANRTSSSSYRGPGIDAGLRMLEAVKTHFDVNIITDIHEPYQAERVGKVADILQIPAFLSRQTDLLTAAARTGRIVNIKKGQWLSPSVMKGSVAKVRDAGNPNVMVRSLPGVF